MLKGILGSIVLLFSPLSTDSLASLINFPGKNLGPMLDYLHSILDAQKDAQSASTTLHFVTSFLILSDALIDGFR